MHYSIVSTVQYITVQYSELQRSAVQYSPVNDFDIFQKQTLLKDIAGLTGKLGDVSEIQ